MAINDRDCPNCGAPVDFAGSTRATCSFCRSQLYLTDAGVKASSALNDLLENQPVTHGVDGDSLFSARFRVPIYGPKRTGNLQVSGSWRKGIWDLSVNVVYDEDGEEQAIQITQKVK